MTKLNRLTADDRAELVAYLDGELDEERTRQIEAVLAQNAVARADVELLARSYELLDQLPRPKAPAEFTERTVATARIEEYRVPLSQQAWFRRSQKWGVLGLWTVAIVTAAMTGYGLAYQWVPRESDLLLDRYPVIHRLNDYREVGSIDFLDALQGDKELLQKLEKEGG